MTAPGVAPVRSVVVHGHFYQPPRENPWLEVVEREANAAPAHDWNARIERECYGPVAAARVLARSGRIARMVNLYEAMSFNVGATLLEWMERAAPATYRAILDADRASARRLDGHGNAIAMPYHHVILPLATRRDKRTEVRWGIADFRRRFGRVPEGMWLPETAVDEETLEVLADEGIKFTILAPHQVEHAPADGMPLKFDAGRGRTIALFVYDGPAAHDVAFGDLLRDGARLAARLMPDAAIVGSSLRSIATDGETFGHHHRFGEMALVRAFDLLNARNDVRVENFASVLARTPPVDQAVLVSPTSWSCAHGIERWRSDCGCRTDKATFPSQAWRAPLRSAIDWLAMELRVRWFVEASEIFTDPDAARDAYGEVVALDGAPLDAFAREWVALASDVVRARELLELERVTLRMFTSCAWFFDDVAGLEPRQVLRYAARAMELANDDGALRAGLLSRLALARSNEAAEGNGADVYRRYAAPARPVELRVAAGWAVSRALETEVAADAAPCFDVHEDGDRLVLTHRRTGATTGAECTVRRDRAGGVIAEVRRDGEAISQVLGPADFTEGHAAAVSRALASDEIHDLLNADLRADLLHGAKLERVAAIALVHALRMLRFVVDPEECEELVDRNARLLRLVEHAGVAVPYDALVAFVTARDAMPALLHPQLAPLADRLGVELPP